MEKNLTISYPIMSPFVVMGIYVLLFAGLYHTAFLTMVKWWETPDYSYGYLIPFIVLYLLWERKEPFKNKPSIPTWWGLFPFVTGIFLFWLGELGGEFYILYLSSWAVLVGLCILNFGVEKVKIIGFPICFILTMFPLPNFFNFKITLVLKLLSSKLGVMMMQAYGMSAFREGNVIDLGFTRLQVVDACSGLRFLFPMLVLSLVVAYFYKASLWKKVFVVLSSIPLIILTNSFRIALTGILSEKFGSAIVEGFFHDFEGWLIFMVTIGVLLLEIWIMEKVFAPSSSGAPLEPILKKNKTTEPLEGSALKREALNRPALKSLALKGPQFILSFVLLGLMVLVSRGIEFREVVPMKKKFDTFPSRIGRWEGTKNKMDKSFIDKLDFTDYIMVDFQDDQGKRIDFYVAYYASQRKGESIHSPASCLRGGGWEFQRAKKSFVLLSDKKTRLPVNTAVIKKGTQHQISCFWFPSRGRNLTNAYEMKWFNFWDALTQKRTDGALVRVISHVYPDENPEKTQKRLQAFIKQMAPVLFQFLPN